MTLAWNWRKGTSRAFCIRTKHVVSVAEVAEILCWWVVCEDDDDRPDTMTPTEIEDIVRRTYKRFGSSWIDDVWRDEQPMEESEELLAWATDIVARAWPTQSRPVKP